MNKGSLIIFTAIIIIIFSILIGCQGKSPIENEVLEQKPIINEPIQEVNKEKDITSGEKKTEDASSEKPLESEKFTISYWLGEAGEKTTDYIISTLKDGKKVLAYDGGDIILTGFEDYDLMLNLVFAKKDGKWGLYDKTGIQIIDHVFDEIQNAEMPDGFKANGLVGVKAEGLWGAVDQSGTMIIKPEYEFIELNYYEEVEPFIKVKQREKYGYLTRKGKPLVDIKWDAAFMDVLNVPEDIIFVKEDGRWGGIRVQEGKAAEVDWDVQPFEEAKISFNNWKYEYQYDFYLRQIQNGEINISLCTIIFFNDYFSNNPSEIRSLPAYSLGQVPNWDELSKYIYEKATNVSYETGITEEQFDNLVKKYFGNINYTHKSSHYLTLEDGRYIPIGWSDHGGYIYELTSLEKDKTQDGKNKWKAAITGYYFNEMDGSPDEPVSNQSKNAQAVWEEMKKEDYKGLNHWQARDRLVWNNPDSILEPSRQWVIEFVVNNPMDDVYFTYLSCQ